MNRKSNSYYIHHTTYIILFVQENGTEHSAEEAFAWYVYVVVRCIRAGSGVMADEVVNDVLAASGKDCPERISLQDLHDAPNEGTKKISETEVCFKTSFLFENSMSASNKKKSINLPCCNMIKEHMNTNTGTTIAFINDEACFASSRIQFLKFLELILVSGQLPTRTRTTPHLTSCIGPDERFYPFVVVLVGSCP